MSRLLVRSLPAALLAGCVAITAASAAPRLTKAQRAAVAAGASALARRGSAAAVASVPALSMRDAASQIADPLEVAASWDATTARLYGADLAGETRAAGANVVALPLGAFGDTALAAYLAAPLVRGVQSGRVVAAAFGGTGGPGDQETLHESQWPLVEAAISGGKAGAVTCSLRNGRPASLCVDRHAFGGMLSRLVRFRGFAIGLGASFATPERVLSALHAAHVPAGLPHASDPAPNVALSRRIAQSGAVLVKNDASVLPFAPAATSSLLVVGADAPTLAALRGAFPATRVVTADSAGAAAAAAKGAAGCVVILGPAGSADEEKLVRVVAAVNPRTAVVLERSPSSVPAWAVSVPSLLLLWAPQPGTPGALANLLSGRAAPDGHLPHAIAGTGAAAALPFGFGLTYTRFVFSHLTISYGRGPKQAPVTVSFTIHNAGSRSGTAVPQLYLRFPASAAAGGSALTAFTRVTLGVGKTRRISFPLKARSFAYWSPSYKAWYVAPGVYRASVGSSQGDPALGGTIRIVARR